MGDVHVPAVTIRAATEADLAAIWSLVYELATYEKAPECVTATLDDYRKDFKEGVFDAIVATQEEDTIVGMALFYTAYSTWRGRYLYLEDFIVTESKRGAGLGKLLFEEVLAVANRQGARLLKWQVLDWNTPALRFYAKYDAIIEKEWWNGKIMFV